MAADITSNLELYCKLDEAEGETTAADSSGNGRHGTVVGGASIDFVSDGQVGGGLQRFAGGDKVTFGALGLLDTDQTIAFFFRNDGSADHCYPVSTRGNTTGGFSVFINQNTQIQAHFGGTGGGNRIFPEIHNGGRHHVALVYDKSAAIVTNYNNAVAQTPYSCAGHPWHDGTNTQLFEREGGTVNIDATLDEVRIYSRALSAEDIAALYAFTGAIANSEGETANDIASDIASDVAA